MLDYQQANPATLLSAMKLALAYHPTAVGLSGLPEVVWQSEVSAYKAAGVSIVPYAVAPVTVSASVITDIDGAADNEKYGEMLGDWAIADSGGKAHVLFVNVPAIAILNYVYTGFQKAFTDNCPKCSITVLNQTVADATGPQLTQATVSALQRNTALTYAVNVDERSSTGSPLLCRRPVSAAGSKIAGQAGDPCGLDGRVKRGNAGLHGSVRHAGRLVDGGCRTSSRGGHVDRHRRWRAANPAIREGRQLPGLAVL